MPFKPNIELPEDEGMDLKTKCDWAYIALTQQMDNEYNDQDYSFNVDSVKLLRGLRKNQICEQFYPYVKLAHKNIKRDMDELDFYTSNEYSTYEKVSKNEDALTSKDRYFTDLAWHREYSSTRVGVFIGRPFKMHMRVFFSWMTGKSRWPIS